MKVLLASDGFVTEPVLHEALTAELPEADLATLTTGWPVPPFTDVEDVHEAAGDTDALIEALAGCSVAFSHVFPFTRRVIESSPELELVTICRGGPVNVSLAAATEQGVMVSFTPGRNARATAEHSVAMMLDAVRQIAQRHHEILQGRWASDHYVFDRAAPELGASTVGLIGYGAVGALVAQILRGFGTTVLAFDPWAQRAGVEVEFVDSLPELLDRSDIVSLHARATAENAHLIDADALSLMKPGAILVNCARGSLVDYDAVCDALDSGRLRAAAFDVLPLEPLPADHRLLRTPRVTMTPHLAGASQEAARIAARIGAADIARFARGETPIHLANPDVLDVLRSCSDHPQE